MAFLEIIHLTGDSDRHQLNKQQPVSIGSHASNDIQIDEAGVEIMHCRISWGKKGFEAVAAGIDPIEVNNTPMQRAELKPGDVLRFGTVDVRFRESEADGTQQSAPEESAELGLKPISEEIEIFQKTTPPPKKSAPEPKKTRKRPQPESTSPPPRRTAKKKAEKKQEKPPKKQDIAPWEEEGDDIPSSMVAGLDALAEESLADVELPSSRKPKKKSRKSKPVEKSDVAPPPEAPPADEPQASPDTSESSDGITDRVRTALRSSQVRPGEEDPFRSPLVLGLTGAAVALLLTGAIFYFIANRQTVQDRFDAAQSYYDEGNFISAIKAFQEFVTIYPRNDLAVEARRLQSLAAVRQQVEGASPNFPEGLAKLRDFIGGQRDLDDFEVQHPEIMTQAKSISLGAATTAGRLFDPTLLEISKEARTILRTYAPKDSPPTETLDQIEQALRTSEAAILRNGVYNEHVASMTAAIESEQAPLKALKLRRDLLVRYPEFESDQKVAALHQQALQAELRSAINQDVDRPARAAEEMPAAKTLTLAFQGRTRTDEVSVNKFVVALAKDCCYGVDFVTGAPAWRRVIGWDTPFFPVIEPSLPSIVAFDTNTSELVRIHQENGKLIWRQPVDGFVIGNPLLNSGTLYLTTDAGKLLSVDVETGQLLEEVTFSQPVGSPVELEGQRLVVAGDEEVVYTLSMRPLKCERVSYIGHQPGSVEAPLLAMGSYLLMCENQQNSAILHLLQTEPVDGPLYEVASETVPGRVIDSPVIRGRDLFVPSTGERVTAFSVSDDPGQPPLTAGPGYQGEGGLASAVHLLTGPDRQLWMATGALTRLRLTTDALQPDGDPVSRGAATQPLRYASGYLLHARRRPFSSAATFTRTNRDTLQSDWQTVLGGQILAWTSRTGGTASLAVVNESGHAFRIGERQLAGGNFLSEASSRLPLHQDLVDPLLAGAVSQDRIAIACGGPEPRMWLVNAAGQIEGSPLLPNAPVAPPTAIADRVVVPLAGRLHVARLSGQAPVQDLSLPVGEERDWVNAVSLGTDQGVAVTSDGVILLLRLQTSPRKHLAEVARIELGQPVSLPAAGDGQWVVVADATDRVSLIRGERLEPLGERTFDGGVSSPPRVAGGVVFIEEGQETLHCIDPNAGVATKWTLDLQGSVVGVIDAGSAFVVAQQSGTVAVIDKVTGESLREQALATPLSIGPMESGSDVFVGTVDGTLLNVTELVRD